MIAGEWQREDPRLAACDPMNPLQAHLEDISTRMTTRTVVNYSGFVNERLLTLSRNANPNSAFFQIPGRSWLLGQSNKHEKKKRRTILQHDPDLH